MKKEDHSYTGDLNSLKLFAALLILNNFEAVEYGHRGDGYDLKGIDKNGQLWLFNLKQRYFASDKYGDLMMDKSNYDTLLWAQSNNPNSKVAYVQFFTDKIFISNLQGWSELSLNCPKTTRFSDNRYVQKTVVKKDQNAIGVKVINYAKIDLNKLKNIY